LKLTILGLLCRYSANIYQSTAQILEIKNNIFLIDCGEGTQVQLQKQIKFSKVNHIFISHLHGDHFLVWFNFDPTLLGRTTDLYIHGPVGIKIILLQLRLTNSWTNYKLFSGVRIKGE
jgi:ribonuclease Z